MADFPRGDKLIIDELEFVDNYDAAYRIKQLKQENANLKRQLTKLKNERKGNQADSKPANCAIFDVSGSLPDLRQSEVELNRINKIVNPTVIDGKSDFWLGWRWCFDWIKGEKWRQ